MMTIIYLLVLLAFACAAGIGIYEYVYSYLEWGLPSSEWTDEQFAEHWAVCCIECGQPHEGWEHCGSANPDYPNLPVKYGAIKGDAYMVHGGYDADDYDIVLHNINIKEEEGW